MYNCSYSTTKKIISILSMDNFNFVSDVIEKNAWQMGKFEYIKVNTGRFTTSHSCYGKDVQIMCTPDQTHFSVITPMFNRFFDQQEINALSWAITKAQQMNSLEIIYLDNKMYACTTYKARPQSMNLQILLSAIEDVVKQAKAAKMFLKKYVDEL